MSSSLPSQRPYKGQMQVTDPALLPFRMPPPVQPLMQLGMSAIEPEQRALRGRGLMTRGGKSQPQTMVTSPTQAVVAPPLYMDLPNSVVMRNNSSSSSNNNARSSMHRERGVIEKMLHSYGFIQCADKECRLFFHFSELTPDDTFSFSVGDPVEFNLGVDRRSNKPVAVNIVRLPGTDVSCDVFSEKPVVGKVLVPAKQPDILNSQGLETGGYVGDGLGRVTYEQSGETFFLTYSLDDLEITDPHTVQLIEAGDQVEFFISTDERNGNLRARRLHRIGGSSVTVNPVQLYSGVVCSLKDNYGFIERADVVKELFFHFSEFQGNVEDLQMGDDVSFNIQTRNNKEVGVNINLLPPGSVIFEDVAPEKKRGKIQKLLKSVARNPLDPLSGRIVYETLQGSIEIPFGERDMGTEFTMQVGDIVEFYIATDRRDQLQRATNITLVDLTFTVSGEKREQGFIIVLKEDFGFIRCVDRDGRMFFNFAELLNQSREPKLQDEVEFTVLPDPSNVARQIATRVKYLAKGTINEEECVSPIKYIGTVAKSATCPQQAGNKKSPTNRLSGSFSSTADADPGIILYDIDGTKQTIPYSISSLANQQLSAPRLNDHVEFFISESLRNGIKTAVNVRTVGLVEVKPSSSTASVPPSLSTSSGSAGGAVSNAAVTYGNSTAPGNGGVSVTSSTSSGSGVVMRSSGSSHRDKDGKSRRGSSGASLGSSGSDAPHGKPRHSGSTTSSKSRKTNGDRRSWAGQDGGQEAVVSGSPSSSSTTSMIPSSGVSVTSNESSLSVDSDVSGSTGKELGFVATLKDSFGFIEVAERDKEVFFHYSNYEGDAAELDVGDEVEFTFTEKTGRISAARVKKRTKGTIIPEEILAGIYEGEIVRDLRITNPDQSEYCGLIQLCDTVTGSAPVIGASVSGGDGAVSQALYTYGVMSLVDRRELPQKGDLVRFQLSVMRAGCEAETGYRATRVLPTRKLVHSKVESIKGQVGVLSYEAEDGKKVTFSLSDVSTGVDGSAELSCGDDVEFAPIRRPHGGKMIACCIRKIGDRPRPERLSRLKSVAGSDEGPKIIAVRQPRGPDGSKGFKSDSTTRLVTSSSSSAGLCNVSSGDGESNSQ